MIIKCTCCGNEFNRKPSQIKRSKNNFCSSKCHDQYRIKVSIEKFTEKLGEDFKTWISRKYVDDLLSASELSKLLYGNKGNKSTILQWLNRFDIPIRHGSDAIKTQWIDADERREISRNLAHVNLQKKCVRERIKKIQQTEEYKLKQRISKSGNKNGMFGVIGKAHPRWDELRTHEQRTKERKTFEYSQWRTSVFERDNWKCKVCNDNKGGNLIAHHLNSYDKFENERYLVNNGITLCDKCHKSFHSKFGYGKNTREQFELFLDEASIK